jgi:hypothetical protein
MYGPDLAEEFLACVDQANRAFSQLTAGSGRRCWWRCRSCGHEWEAAVANRVRGSGCLRALPAAWCQRRPKSSIHPSPTIAILVFMIIIS